MMSFRVGFGFDVHQLKEGLDFWLGGIIIPHTKGGLGHSDADVLIHTICDALLGAANLGDIGKHFPDTKTEYKGIDSKILLKEVMLLIRNKGYEIGNIDSTICLQTPKIGPYIPEMQKILAICMNVAVDQVSIKATTTEKLSFVGREEGVSAYATVLVNKI
ncbi:MAG: 2-C-methyl-D-erythritol 2,4-cyclodiphosphate synthase [Flavobacteriales bacterium]|nr:2-C-methyl-D-erythritol 2,4-cyclodiphosphate synthase [Flavobacteriales bacterium]MBT5090334.1 2-C-methyl-D-erythritol 2,4-cyclodiphosphate synthase [Flavobacteriales bacterium]MBT5750969.1 2-C-methyl-D-erythritol 2,4-cyclodiphosphate synthase [Flavobacteriales bacterium]